MGHIVPAKTHFTGKNDFTFFCHDEKLLFKMLQYSITFNDSSSIKLCYNGFLLLSISYMSTPADTDALREEICPRIGRETI